MTDEPTSNEPIGPQRPVDDVRGDGDDATNQPPSDVDDELWADPIEAAWGDVLNGRPDPVTGAWTAPPTGPQPDPGAGGGDGTTTPPPPTIPPPPVGRPHQSVRRLERDPTTSLGGVASGVAHYYGLDTSIIRIIFLALAFSTGFGFLLYFLAWMIIPRAEHWPPPGPARSLGSLDSRDLGVVLAIVGLVLALAVGSGGGGFLVPAILVGGGVWLLSQPSRELNLASARSAAAGPVSGTAPPAGAAAPSAPTTASSGATSVPTSGATTATGAAPSAPDGWPSPATSWSDPLVDDVAGAGSDGGWAPPPSAYVAAPQEPARPRRRSRRRTVFLVLLVVLLSFFLVAVLLIGGLVWAVSSGSGEIEINGGPDINRTIDSVDDFPVSYDLDGGHVVIDLSELDAADLDELAELDGPVVDVNVDFGEIEVIVPDDLDVRVDAEAGLGDVSVFGVHDDGIGSSVTVTDPADGDPLVDLRLDVGLGQVTVERG